MSCQYPVGSTGSSTIGVIAGRLCLLTFDLFESSIVTLIPAKGQGVIEERVYGKKRNATQNCN